MAYVAIAWSIVFLMAGDAPAHPQRTYLAHSAHDLHLAMALGAIQAGFYVPFMGKVHVFRQMMYLYPRDRLLFVPKLGQLLHFRSIGRRGFVAGHTLFHRRHSGVNGSLNVFMAESAIQADLRHMDVMGKSDGLDRRLLKLMPVETKGCQQKNKQSKIHIE